MARRIFTLISLLCLLARASAQGPNDPSEGASLTSDSVTGGYTFSWWGRAGRTYFLQHSDDLLTWTYLQLVETGADSPIQWGITSSNSKFFMRLRYSDDPNVDSDGNGLTDTWQIFYFGHLGVDPNALAADGVLTNLLCAQNGLNPNAPLAPSSNPSASPVTLPPLDSLPHISYTAIDVTPTTVQAPITNVALDDNLNLAYAYSDSTAIHTAVFSNGQTGSIQQFPYQGTTTELVSYYDGTQWQTSYPSCNYQLTLSSPTSVNANGSIGGWMFVNLPLGSPGNNYIQSVSRGFVQSGSGPSDFWEYSDNAPSYSPYGDNSDEYGSTNIGNTGLIAGNGSFGGSSYGFVGTGPSSMLYFDQQFSLSSQRLGDHFSPVVFSPNGEAAGQFAVYDPVYGLGQGQYAVSSGAAPAFIGKLRPLAVGNGGVVLGVDENANDANDVLAIYQNGATQHLRAILPSNYRGLFRFPSTSSGWINGNGDIVVNAQVFQTPPPAANGTTPPANWLSKTIIWQRPASGTPTISIIDLPSGMSFGNLKQFNGSYCFSAIGPATTTGVNGNPVTAQNHAQLLVPVQLTQTNYPSAVLPDGTDTGATGQQVISSATGTANIAYITGEPEMPKLKIQIANSSLSGLNVKWWMTSTSDRTVRGHQDDMLVPLTQIGSVTLPINQAWQIDNYYPDTFFGGKATVHYIIQDSNGNNLTPEQRLNFLIRGRNPMDSDAQGYIIDNQGNYDYAWAIAQHESRTPSNKVYNQFATANGSSWGDLGQPFYATVEGNGWGVFQRDPTGGGIAVDTNQVYNWHSNTQVAIQELDQKWTNADQIFRYFRNKFGDQAGWEEPPQNYTVGNSQFSAWDLATMVLYNGAAGCPRSFVVNDQGKTIRVQFPWTFDPNGTPGAKWQFTDNLPNNYATHVIQDEWEAGLPTDE